MLLQPSAGGRATARKAPAGKTAKILESTEALTLRAKAAYNEGQRQEQRRPAAKRYHKAASSPLCVHFTLVAMLWHNPQTPSVTH